MAQILLNMSEGLRDKITDLAKAHGVSRTKYILDAVGKMAGALPVDGISPEFDHLCLRCDHTWTNKKEHPSVCPACMSPRWNKKIPMFDHTCCQCGYKWTDKKESPITCRSCRSARWSYDPNIKNQKNLEDEFFHYLERCQVHMSLNRPQIASRAGIKFAVLDDFQRRLTPITPEIVEAVKRVANGEILAAPEPVDLENLNRQETRNVLRNMLYKLGVSDESSCAAVGETLAWFNLDAIVSQDQLDKLDEFYRRTEVQHVLAHCGKTLEEVAEETKQDIAVIRELAAGTRLPTTKGAEYLRNNYPPVI